MNKNNLYCIILVSVVVIIFLYFLKNNLKKNNMENISPYVMLGALKNKNKNVILVNVLSEKIPYLISCNEQANTLNLGAKEFEEYLKNDSQLKTIDLVILYCASWSCGAAQNYYNKLQSQGLPMDKVVDYKGALHEWSMYSLIFPELFSINNLSNNERASDDEIKKLAKDMLHTYKLKDEKISQIKIIGELSVTGEQLVNNL
jgi:hypothetical protein